MFAVVIVRTTVRGLQRENENLVKEKVKIEQNLEELENEKQKLEKEKQEIEENNKRLESDLRAKKEREAVRVASAIKTPQTAPTKAYPSGACIVAMKKVFPEHLWATGAAIMMAESSQRPNAVGGPNYNGTYDYGCWQINNTQRALDPDEGTKIAWYKYNHSGWSPWVAWKNGKHLRFM